MIIVITTREVNEKNRREELLVSHGIDSVTGKVVILPCDTPAEIGARFDENLREYVLDNPPATAWQPAGEKKPMQPPKRAATPRPKW